MDRYKLFREVGDGTFGNVWRAINILSGEVVAIKKMKKKYYSWEECINLREVKSLRKMNHPNIVKLKEVIRENDILYFVFEYMDCNLYQLIKDRDRLFSEAEIRKWCFQVFQGLAYMHQRGYFHRDLKPENLLVSKEVIKIADLGLAREITSMPPYTEYVSTRWYRAPEVLLQSHLYNFKVDMWAMGAIMAEMFTLRPLFPGRSEADEVHKICSVIGSPTQNTWAEGLRLAEAINYQFPQFAGVVDFSVLLPSASADAINLIKSLCAWDPCKRPTAIEALQHPFFQSCYYVPPSLRPKQTDTRTPPSVARAPLQQQNNSRYPGIVPNSKLTGNLPSARSQAVDAGVIRRPSIFPEDSNNKNDNKRADTFVRQQGVYQPPGMNRQSNGSNIRAGRGWGPTEEAAEKLARTSIGGPLRSDVVPPPRREVVPPPRNDVMPPPMKAGGGWRGAPAGNMYLLRRSQEVQPQHRSYARKVMG